LVFSVARATHVTVGRFAPVPKKKARFSSGLLGLWTQPGAAPGAFGAAHLRLYSSVLAFARTVGRIFWLDAVGPQRATLGCGGAVTTGAINAPRMDMRQHARRRWPVCEVVEAERSMKVRFPTCRLAHGSGHVRK
jgi:hypothetical protein